MNNPHQALIEETKLKLVNTFVLSDDSWDVILQATIDTVIEGERKRIKKEITNQTLLNNGDDIFVSLGKALWVCDSEEERAAFMKALTPLPDKE